MEFLNEKIYFARCHQMFLSTYVSCFSSARTSRVTPLYCEGAFSKVQLLLYLLRLKPWLLQFEFLPSKGLPFYFSLIRLCEDLLGSLVRALHRYCIISIFLSSALYFYFLKSKLVMEAMECICCKWNSIHAIRLLLKSVIRAACWTVLNVRSMFDGWMDDIT